MQYCWAPVGRAIWLNLEGVGFESTCSWMLFPLLMSPRCCADSAQWPVSVTILPFSLGSWGLKGHGSWVVTLGGCPVCTWLFTLTAVIATILRFKLLRMTLRASFGHGRNITSTKSLTWSFPFCVPLSSCSSLTF